MKTAQEFLIDVCPNHTETSKWNKSELLLILEKYKEAIDYAQSCETLPNAKEIVIFAEEESDKQEKNEYTKYDKTSYMFGLMDGARWIKERLKK